MTKFLEIVQESQPDANYDEKYKAKKAIAQLLNSKGITAEFKTLSNKITITYGGKIIDLEITGISKSNEEDGEDDIIAGLLNTNDDHLKNNPAALNAKKTLTNTFVKVAKDVATAASKPISTY